MSRAPKRGDKIEIQFLDLATDVFGDPDDADLGNGTMLGYFWGFKKLSGQECLLTTITKWKGEDWQKGYHIIPKSLVLRIHLL